PGLAQESRARIGERARARRAVEPPRAEPRLERRDAARHRGRRTAELARRRGEAAFARDRDEHFERLQTVHLLFHFSERTCSDFADYRIRRSEERRGGKG